ncbi:acetoin utilization protein AcuC [Nesterenkonia salmonea]|uniref:Acetoin utilization protein AcuC n=1 Tax=Nesterenkonia salmonea TaxID=1804987 RepID=A0A5R9BAW4_9MICC|nr:acetoin utilization protein AcuC [Nesterenkonia salmonea]TLP95825.1 acetoin utilization protein AcuC [Nesterenkonia salmonea]
MSHRFTDSHPMDPVRLDLTERLSRELGIFDAANLTLTAPAIADDDALATVHDRSYISAVSSCSDSGESSPEHGLGTDDVPVFADMHTSAARIAGGTLHLAQEIVAGRAVHGVNFAGGMHHAARNRASGFCIYNDAALAIQHLLDNGTRRVVYIDVDAHHGDGTQDIFYADPRVMTISLHQSGTTIYPGTGFPNETGQGEAVGTSVNIALPATTGDSGFLRAFHSVVPALVRAFEPEVIVSQHGCDAHADDPLTDLTMSVDGQRQLALDISHLAEEFAENRWIATGGGGYSIYRVVPRAWAHLTAVAAGHPIPLKTPTPVAWRDYVGGTFGVSTPATMNDDAQLWWRTWELGYDPEDAVDRAIIQTRKEIFPLQGLDPWFD